VRRRSIEYPLTSLTASTLTGMVRNVHTCGECGALVATEARVAHTIWHQRQEAE
jgi:hypothetical protein